LIICIGTKAMSWNELIDIYTDDIDAKNKYNFEGLSIEEILTKLTVIFLSGEIITTNELKTLPVNDQIGTFFYNLNDEWAAKYIKIAALKHILL
jgi:hypothetical protein